MAMSTPIHHMVRRREPRLSPRSPPLYAPVLSPRGQQGLSRKQVKHLSHDRGQDQHAVAKHCSWLTLISQRRVMTRTQRSTQRVTAEPAQNWRCIPRTSTEPRLVAG